MLIGFTVVQMGLLGNIGDVGYKGGRKVDDAVGNFSLANLDLFSITRSGFFLVFMVPK